jgi:hypothetical protein
MAKVSGAAAYQMLRKPDNIVNDTIQQTIQTFENRRAEGDKIREVKRQEGIVAKKEWDSQYKYDPNIFLPIDTGDKDYDALGRDIAQQYSDKYYDLHEKALNEKDPTQKRLYENNMKAIQGNIGKVKELQTLLKGKLEGYAAAVQKGDVSGVEGKHKDIIMEQVAKGSGIRVVIDQKSMQPAIVGINKETGEPFEIPYNQLHNGDWGYTKAQKVIGEGSLTNTITKDLKTITKDKYGKSDYIVTEQDWTPEIEKSAYAMIDTTLSSKDVKRDLFFQLVDPKNETNQKGDLTDEQLGQLKPKLLELIKAQYSTKTEANADPTLERKKQNARENEWKRKEFEQKQKEYADKLALDWYDAKKTESNGGSGVPSNLTIGDVTNIKTTTTLPSGEVVETNSPSISFPFSGGKTFELFDTQKDKKGIKSKVKYEVQNVIVSDDGKFYIDTQGLGGKERKEIKNTTDKTVLAAGLSGDKMNAQSIIDYTKQKLQQEGVSENTSTQSVSDQEYNNFLNSIK